VRPDRKSTQRDRLLAGMTEALAAGGYAETTIGGVIARAGVSRPTFYEYFTDKHECFVAVLADAQEALIARLQHALGPGVPEDAVYAAVACIVTFADAEPESARILMNEPMAASGRALDIRDQGLATIEAIIEERYRDVSPASAVPDIPARALIGGLYRLVAACLRSGSPGGAHLLDDLLAWLKRYELPLAEHRWRALEPASMLAPSPIVVAPLRPPGPLSPGRPRLSKEEIADHQRQRLLLAAASLAEEKGYSAVTVMDLTRRARVDTRSFYRLFPNKREVFRALHELLFRQIIAVTASGFSAGNTWPERVWEAGRAFAQYVEQNPTLAHASFVDSHAGDAQTVQRVDELVGGFTVFLQEGYRHTSHSPPSSVAQQAIASTMFEIDYSQVREARVGELSRLVPHMAFISLAPFLGCDAVNQFIDTQLGVQAQKR
jgi:AcrR family transcriptional regulator